MSQVGIIWQIYIPGTDFWSFHVRSRRLAQFGKAVRNPSEPIYLRYIIGKITLSTSLKTGSFAISGSAVPNSCKALNLGSCNITDLNLIAEDQI